MVINAARKGERFGTLPRGGPVSH